MTIKSRKAKRIVASLNSRSSTRATTTTARTSTASATRTTASFAKRIKRKQAKHVENAKPETTGWDTTDEDEIARRRLRGETEKFSVENLEPKQPYFSSFLLSSKNNSKHEKQYCVEIRSLTERTNSCDCPDYRSNKLGTCKHIEHVLWRLRKSGVRAFKQAAQIGSPYLEIFLEHRTSTICFVCPQKTVDVAAAGVAVPATVLAAACAAIDPFFSIDGTLMGNPVLTYPALRAAVTDFGMQQHSRKPKCEGHKWSIRVSRHIDHFINYQRSLAQKQTAREIFLNDVACAKKTLTVVNHQLYPYQQEGMLHLAFTERALLADEMGLGKTVQAIAACELLRRQKNIERVLVVATASLKAEWEEQIAKFTGLSSLVIQGSRANRLRQYQQSAFFYLTNYEQIVADGPDIQRLLMPDIIILDEAQRIKNWHTKAAAAVKDLKSSYAFVLTGTPLENRIDDVYSIVQFLDPQIFGSLFHFNRDFYTLDEQGKPIGYKNLDELHKRLRSVMLRRRKSDVEEQLPARTVNNYFVGMESEQLQRYAEYKDKVARLMRKAKQHRLRKEEFEMLQRWLACMRMLCDTPYILDQECRISPKLHELESILDELLVDETAKVIIFSEWEKMLQLVRELAQRKNLDAAWHTGSVPQHKRRQDIKRFKTDPNCRLFLSTDSGSVGLNLQSANIVINLDLPWNPAKLEQRIARAWRKHQTRSVQVINLVCEDSIEHRMLSLLAQKQTLAKGVVDGEEGITEMELPSGRAAFMERMESLMGSEVAEEGGNTAVPQQAMTSTMANTDVAEQQSLATIAESGNAVPAVPAQQLPMPQPSAPQILPINPTQNVCDALLSNMHDHIDLLQTHRNHETGQHTVLAVIDKPTPEAQQQLQQSFATLQNKDAVVTLEMLDRNTFAAIQRLVEAGVLTLNQPAEMLHTSTAFAVTKNSMQEKQRQKERQKQQQQINQAQKHLEQAARKQKMAQVLIASDFHAEALVPLKDALSLTLSSFAWLTGERVARNKDGKRDEDYAADDEATLAKEILSQRFIQEKLIAEHGLPQNSGALFMQLEQQQASEQIDEVDCSQIKSLLVEHQEIYRHVDAKLNEKIIELNAYGFEASNFN